MSLVKFTRNLPAHWATCGIYLKGQEVEVERDGAKSIEIACGKRPIGFTHHSTVSPERTALVLERNPDRYGAVGVYTGPRSVGLVCLDIDVNLSVLRKEWEEDLGGFHVTSPTPEAGKWFFTIPQDKWLSVDDVSRAATKRGFEVLWGRQAIICGAYPDGGEYVPHGDPNAIPEAPGWLLALMQESYELKRRDEKKRGIVSSKYSLRSREETAAIAQSCLNAIRPEGGGEDLWWRVGAMLHSELPGEEGLELWREWSQRDPDYEDHWRGSSDPCAERWTGFKNKGTKGLGFGSLVNLADEFDPNRDRFQKDGLTALVEEIEATPIRYRQDYLAGQELLDRALKLEDEIENPAVLDQAKHLLGLEAGRRDGALTVDRLLDTHLTFERSGGIKESDLSTLDDSGFEYLVPGLIPKPWLLLVHADGGTGKSAMAQTLCKHVTQGMPFNVHGKMFDVPRGKALWLNGDQSERVLRRQFELIGVNTGVDVVAEWDMAWYRRFCRMQKKGTYDLIVIDSLDGCNDSNPYEENRREYALPLKKLARRNGIDFPACSIVVLHHNNRNGNFRGTSSIKAAVDETWNMQKLDAAMTAKLELPFNSRLITVEKSRDDREGQEMVFTLQQDFTYKIGTPESAKLVRGNTPNDYMLDLLDLFADETTADVWSAPMIEAHEKLGGDNRTRAIRYSLQKLEAQKLIERCDPPTPPSGRGKPPAFYRLSGSSIRKAFSKRSSRAQGESEKECVKNQTPCTGTDLNDKTVCQKSSFVNNPTPTPSQDPEGGAIIDKPALLTNPLSNKNDCAAVDLNKDTEPHVHKGEQPSGAVTDEERQASINRWKL